MLKVNNIQVFNFDRALFSARNPLNSWDKSSPEANLDLARRLYKAGSEHRKYLRQIMICCDILAPLYWWKEFDTYKVGTTANSCSTMHTLHKRELVMEDFSTENIIDDCKSTFEDYITLLNVLRLCYVETKDKQMWYTIIQMLPSSFNQLRTVTMNYENLVNIIHQRSHHKLNEWHQFIDAFRADTNINEIIGNDQCDLSLNCCIFIHNFILYFEKMVIDNIKSLSIVLLVCVCAYQHMKLDSYRAETIKAQEQARTESIQLSDKLNKLNEVRENEQKEADRTISDLRKRVANGVHINRKTVSSNTTAGNTESRCELSGADAEFFITVAERADNNARKLNQCIDAYNALRKGD